MRMDVKTATIVQDLADGLSFAQIRQKYQISYELISLIIQQTEVIKKGHSCLIPANSCKNCPLTVKCIKEKKS